MCECGSRGEGRSPGPSILTAGDWGIGAPSFGRLHWLPSVPGRHMLQRNVFGDRSRLITMVMKMCYLGSTGRPMYLAIAIGKAEVAFGWGTLLGSVSILKMAKLE